MKIKIFKFFVTTFCACISIFTISGCKTCSRSQWKQVYDAYTKETDRFVYESINATIIKSDYIDDEKIMRCYLSIDKEDYCDRYKDKSNVETAYYEYQSQTFYFVDENISILESAGFFEDISENTVITFIVNNYIGWDGWRYPIFSVEIDGKIYLDFDIGYENVLKYVEEQMKG